MPSLRRIAALALPALVVLAAEPIYVLVDTAVVGHLPAARVRRRRQPAVGRTVPAAGLPAHLGLTGSAIANASAQTAAGLLFARALVAERVSLRPHLAVIGRQLVLGRDLLVRGAAFQACFLSASAVAARFGEAALAAHQIALQLWLFCALALDAVAIAAQALVGAALGGARAGEARRLGRRIAAIGGVCGV